MKCHMNGYLLKRWQPVAAVLSVAAGCSLVVQNFVCVFRGHKSS